MRRWAVPAALLALLCLGAAKCPPVPPTPTPTPTPAPPPPSPVCQPGEVCGCWHQPPGQDWQQLPPCPTPPPACPASCPAGQVCTDPATGCVPTPPPPAGCVLAGQPGAPIPDYVPQLGATVNAVMAVLRPDCEVGGRCVLTEGRQEWQAKVEARLRAAGLCAGQHEAGTDEMAVARALDTPWEGWHVYAGPDTGPGTVVWSPQAARGAYAAPGPPPTMCPDPRPDRSPGKLKILAKQHLKWIDATPQTVGTCDYCLAIGLGWYGEPGGTPRCGCAMRPEGNPDRVACELYALHGGYVWEVRPAGEVVINADNPAQASCIGCAQLRVCSADGSVCSDWIDAP